MLNYIQELRVRSSHMCTLPVITVYIYITVEMYWYMSTVITCTDRYSNRPSAYIAIYRVSYSTLLIIRCEPPSPTLPKQMVVCQDTYSKDTLRKDNYCIHSKNT